MCSARDPGALLSEQSLKSLPLTSLSACSSWWLFAQGGGGALLLVLLKVDSADLYRETMTWLEDVWETLRELLISNKYSKHVNQFEEVISHHQPTCGPLTWQVLRLLGTLCDAPMGGWGARLFLGISAGRVQEEETPCAFIPTPTSLLRPGDAGALTAPSCEEGNVHFVSQAETVKENLHSSEAAANSTIIHVTSPASRRHYRTISAFFFLLLNKLRNPVFSFCFFFFFGRSI